MKILRYANLVLAMLNAYLLISLVFAGVRHRQDIMVMSVLLLSLLVLQLSQFFADQRSK